MRPFPVVRLLCAAVLVCVSCGAKSRFLPDLPCFDAEKLKAAPLVFGELSPDANVPGGWSGMEVRFGVDSAGRLVASIRESGGASPQIRPVQRVTYDASEDSLSLIYKGPATTRYVRTYRPRCDRLVGFTTYFRSPEDSSGIAVEDTLPHVQSR